MIIDNHIGNILLLFLMLLCSYVSLVLLRGQIAYLPPAVEVSTLASALIIFRAPRF